MDDAAAWAPEAEVELRGGRGEEVVAGVSVKALLPGAHGTSGAYTSLLVSTASARSALPPLNCFEVLSCRR